MSALNLELKQLIIDTLNLEDISVDEIDDNAPLFIEGLGLDSIDALELGMAIKKKYAIVLDANAQETRKHFASVQALANLVASQQ